MFQSSQSSQSGESARMQIQAFVGDSNVSSAEIHRDQESTLLQQANILIFDKLQAILLPVIKHLEREALLKMLRSTLPSNRFAELGNLSIDDDLKQYQPNVDSISIESRKPKWINNQMRYKLNINIPLLDGMGVVSPSKMLSEVQNIVRSILNNIPKEYCKQIVESCYMKFSNDNVLPHTVHVSVFVSNNNARYLNYLNDALDTYMSVHGIVPFQPKSLQSIVHNMILNMPPETALWFIKRAEMVKSHFAVRKLLPDLTQTVMKRKIHKQLLTIHSNKYRFNIEVKYCYTSRSTDDSDKMIKFTLQYRTINALELSLKSDGIMFNLFQICDQYKKPDSTAYIHSSREDSMSQEYHLFVHEDDLAVLHQALTKYEQQYPYQEPRIDSKKQAKIVESRQLSKKLLAIYKHEIQRASTQDTMNYITSIIAKPSTKYYDPVDAEYPSSFQFPIVMCYLRGISNDDYNTLTNITKHVCNVLQNLVNHEKSHNNVQLSEPHRSYYRIDVHVKNYDVLIQLSSILDGYLSRHGIVLPQEEERSSVQFKSPTEAHSNFSSSEYVKSLKRNLLDYSIAPASCASNYAFK